MILKQKDVKMEYQRLSQQIIGGGFALLLLVGCSTPTASTSIPILPTASPLEMPKGPETEWHLVVIGDSSFW